MRLKINQDKSAVARLKTIRLCGPGFFADRGLVSLVELHRDWHEEIVAPTHEQLALESG